ncbi:MAG: hypothetical protein KME42_03155 [Tildeniella nuda ZEHNDER 1965/U140]|jgi:hypothetical protein|nr:hypothetical protein [Tildeniella nuda ZEHNDER 1965/U140]
MEPVLNISTPLETIALPQPSIALRKPKSWSWLKIELAIFLILGSIAGASCLWLLSLPPVTNCQQISPLTPDIDRLSCAQQAAQSGELPKVLAGLKLVEEWTPEHPLHQEAQRWMADWSQSVLTAAHQKMSQSDLNGALALVRQIPQSSAVYKEAQESVAGWQKQWRQSAAIYAKAQQAMQAQQWSQASEQIASLREMDYEYWRSQQANALTGKLLQEQKARKLFSQAQQAATAGKPEALSAAIALVSQMGASTYARSDAQSKLNQWSEALLTFGEQQWQAGNLDRTIAAARSASLNPELTEEADRLLWLSYAQRLKALSLSNWQATPEQTLKLAGAMALAQQVPPESRFYHQAQISLKQAQAHLQAVTQLQLAQFIASPGQPITYELAIAQANHIAPDSPRRLQAQTLSAHWHRETQRLTDRPILATARTLAAAGTIPALQAAIAQATQIKQGHALYGEAQSLAFVWKQQIETVVDQPILNQAEALARENHLSEAIQLASSIRPGRVLYLQAQEAIDPWDAQIRSAEAQRQAREAVLTPKKGKTKDSAPLVRPDLLPSDPTFSAASPLPALTPVITPVKTFPRATDEIRLAPRVSPTLQPVSSPSAVLPPASVSPPEAIEVLPPATSSAKGDVLLPSDTPLKAVEQAP